MKNILIALFTLLYLSNCSQTDDNSKKDVLEGSWNLSKISGGFAGIDEDYPDGNIVWTFVSSESQLEINNNNTANTLYDGLPTGEYIYTLLTVDNELFLEINGDEFAGILLSGDRLTLDQNRSSSGSGADGFVLQFQR